MPPGAWHFGTGDHAIGCSDAQVEGQFRWVTGEVAPICENALFMYRQAGEPYNLISSASWAGEDVCKVHGTDEAAPGQWKDVLATLLGNFSAAIVDIAVHTSSG